QRVAGLGERNLEFIGAITSDEITDADLRAGKFAQATVYESVIDWRYPWAGAFHTATYWIGEITRSTEHWEAIIGGHVLWIERPVGRIYSRLCDTFVGDPVR